jgi:hypothetical protein
MNYIVVWPGGLLIAIGFVIVVRPRNLPTMSTKPANSFDELSFPSHRKHLPPDTESRRRTLVRLFVGVGVMALGRLCLALGY